jgi:hypothetical protein
MGTPAAITWCSAATDVAHPRRTTTAPRRSRRWLRAPQPGLLRSAGRPRRIARGPWAAERRHHRVLVTDLGRARNPELSNLPCWRDLVQEHAPGAPWCLLPVRAQPRPGPRPRQQPHVASSRRRHPVRGRPDQHARWLVVILSRGLCLEQRKSLPGSWKHPRSTTRQAGARFPQRRRGCQAARLRAVKSTSLSTGLNASGWRPSSSVA